MTKNIKHRIFAGIVTILITFAVLFDPTELNLGGTLINVPIAIQTIAELIGNITWIIGAIYLIITIGMLAYLGANKTTQQKLMQAVVEEDATYRVDKPGVWKILFRALNVTTALVAVGSGFWFVGLTLLIGTLVSIKTHKQTEETMLGLEKSDEKK